MNEKRKSGISVGFVPTMGALHEGHLSLVHKSLEENELTIVSVFVNPNQFNKLSDFEKYPIKTEEDTELLKNAGCQVLFIPEKEEVYPDSYKSPQLDLGILNSVMEGKFRPGHFDGVVQVVYRFFDVLNPTRAYFGLKDFQQVAVIQKMVTQLSLAVKIITIPTLRNNDGLALSSRNLRLDPTQLQEATFIYQSLLEVKKLAKTQSPKKIKDKITSLYANSKLKLEYFELIDSDSFDPLEENWTQNAIACVVAYLGEVRLIDNTFVF